MKMAVRGSMNLTSVRKIVTDKWQFYIEDCLRIICLNKNHILVAMWESCIDEI